MSARADLPAPLRIGVESAVAALVVVLALLLSGAMEPVELLFPGSRGHAPDLVGADFDTSLPDRFSYDGQDTYLIARSFPDLDAAHRLGVAEFRLRRMLHPAVAAIAPPGIPTLALLVLANLIGVGLAAGGLASLCQSYGHDPRAGYAAAAALMFSLVISTTEPLAFGLGLVGLAAIARDRLFLATVLLGLAGLTRETALVMAVASGIVLLLRRRPFAAAGVVIGSMAPVAVWSVYVRSQVPADGYQSSKPLGFLDADLSSADIVVAIGVIALLVIGAWRWRREPLLGLTALGYLACCAFYIGYSFRAEGLPRVSAAGVAIGLAGIFTWREARRSPSQEEQLSDATTPLR